MKEGIRKGRILVVDDEEKIRTILATVLRDAGYEVEMARDGMEALGKSSEFKPELLIADLQMPRMDGMETILRIKERLPNTVSIILTAHGTIPSAVQAIKQGVYDYLTKPFDNEQMLLVVRRALDVYQLREEVDQLRRELRKKYTIEDIIGESSVMEGLRQQIRRIAETDATVLIEGESGTGKELVARAIHYESKRRNDPLLIVDCAAIPSNLIESEFFGHEKGAFTDAREQRIGKFEEANSGSIFLDEVGEFPLDAQTKLLRVLQEKEFTRVGGTVSIKVDVRVIAATNKNLEEQVKNGKFREDLFYRINVLRLLIPPLREHKEDIPAYAHHFLAKYRDTFRKDISSISDDALQLLKSHDWKGNIRELESVVQRAMLNTEGQTIGTPDLKFLDETGARGIPSYDGAGGLEAYVRALTEQTEKDTILRVLNEVNWNRTAAAEKLKISRKTLFNKMQQYGLERG